MMKIHDEDDNGGDDFWMDNSINCYPKSNVQKNRTLRRIPIMHRLNHTNYCTNVRTFPQSKRPMNRLKR